MTDTHRKSILVTGSTSGIGLALVHEALFRGFKVYAGYRKAIPPALFDSLRETEVEWIRLDVCDIESIEAAAQEVESIDVLINCAGVLKRSDILDKEVVSSIASEMDVNFFGIVRMTVAFHKSLERSKSGKIFNVLSTTSIEPISAVPGYSASKAAAFSFTESTRERLKALGVNVASVFVDAVDTPMTKGIDVKKIDPSEVAIKILDNVASQNHIVAIGPLSEELVAAHPSLGVLNESQHS